MVSVHRPDFVVVVPALISRVAGGGSSFSGMKAEFAAASVDYAGCLGAMSVTQGSSGTHSRRSPERPMRNSSVPKKRVWTWVGSKFTWSHPVLSVTKVREPKMKL